MHDTDERRGGTFKFYKLAFKVQPLSVAHSVHNVNDIISYVRGVTAYS